MPFDPSIDINAMREERRKAVQESLQTISVEELRKVAKAHEEEFADDPSRDESLRLMDEQPRAGFYSPHRSRTSLFITAATQTSVSGC